MTNQAWLWIAFNALVAALLYLDLAIVNRKAHTVSFREAAWWSAGWIGVALLFNLGIHFVLGPSKAIEFLTAYVVEKSLSVDNMFVFILIFSHFGVGDQFQARILRWGILGALIMRLILILAGVKLIQTFHWVVYLFGAILIYTGIKMGIATQEEIQPEENLLLRVAKRYLPFTDRAPNGEFFLRENGRLLATPFFAALLVVEASDLVFAVDSIPAVLAISQDTFIVYTSNAFAILGLRALYFLLAGMMGLFHYLKVGLSVILCYVGAKMLLVDFIKIQPLVSLAVVLGILALSIAASIVFKKREEEEAKA